MVEIENNERWEMDIFRLDIIRKAKGITHQTIGDALGMQQSNISKFFSASNRPSYELMKNIAGTLGIEIKLFDESKQINMDFIDIEAKERLEALNSATEKHDIDASIIKEWWRKHSERKQRKLIKEYFFPADASTIDPEFGLTHEELQEIYEKNQ